MGIERVGAVDGIRRPVLGVVGSLAKSYHRIQDVEAFLLRKWPQSAPTQARLSHRVLSDMSPSQSPISIPSWPLCPGFDSDPQSSSLVCTTGESGLPC